MRVAFLGTRGVPAQYGGFETAIEQLGQRIASQNVDVYVYGAARSNGVNHWLGMKLIAMPALKSKSLETISRTTLSALHVILRLRPDVVILMNSANAPLITLIKLFRIPVIAHLDGQEWLRPKWRGLRARYSKWATKWAAHQADAVIADNIAIKKYLDSEYSLNSIFIPYGSNISALPSMQLRNIFDREKFVFNWADYFLVVARWEQENHVLEAIQAFNESGSTRSMVVVGSQVYVDDYGRSIHKAAQTNPNVHVLGSIWDKDLLAALYEGAAAYIHGHSVGGTNPSLLHALHANIAVLSFDCEFNESVAKDKAKYWGSVADLRNLIARQQDFDTAPTRSVSFSELYNWDSCAQQYLELAQSVAPGKR
ncbi:MAG: DUF1972 domain-containing protein [Actinobacteria bacterium]|uniref:Unannotated protein n=1 Tax=freshwater metagenome TaxID=449393 RepID=A0A6J5ZDA5_9ZZZZ|nr:DUF1972 domain-containing protein [Actinomycetota bacterium]